MKTIAYFSKGALALLCLLVVRSGCQPTGGKVATIIVMGRSGTGISTSVAQILGPDNTINAPTEVATMVKEYDIPIPGSPNSFLRVVDVEGLVDGKSLAHDANVLSSLKSYISNPSTLNGAPPNFFLVISNFDDNNLRGKGSSFVQLVKRVELIQNAIYGHTLDNTMFLMTKLLSESKERQKFPEEKLETFRQSVRDYTSFEDPIEMVVGENYGRKLPSGYIKLSNKEEYPKNIFDKLIQIAERQGDNVGSDVVTAWRDSRNTRVEINSKYQAYVPQIEDETEFSRLISGFKYQLNNMVKQMVNLFDNFMLAFA